MNDALHELRRPNEDARFGMDDRFLFQLRHSTAAAISAHAYRIGAEDNLLCRGQTNVTGNRHRQPDSRLN
jgi:hypothetical protein